MIPTPELDKLREIKDKCQAIGAFLEWYQSEEGGGCLCTIVEDEYNWKYFRDHRSIEKLLSEYFEIDLNKVEQEKDALLDEMRQRHASK